MKLPVCFLTLAVLLSTLLCGATEVLPSEIGGARRILVLGDSITYSGAYVDLFEAAVRRADPAWRGAILALGLPSETVSGDSEEGHAGGRFPRPDLHERLDRVLAQTRPDLVLACYGMNDGIYHPLSEERFARFRAGIERLREKVRASSATLIHLTPPVFDARPIKYKVLPEGAAAYPTPFAGYDEVLHGYSTWLLEQRARGWRVIDLHGPMRRTLDARRKANPTFAFSKDGVHPDRAGHAVMAQALLAGLGFASAQVDAVLRWADDKDDALLKLLAARRKVLSDAWLTATGHKRPGMAVGKPLADAEREAAEIGRKIQAELARR